MSAADDALRRDLEALAERWWEEYGHAEPMKSMMQELRAVLDANPVPTRERDPELVARILRVVQQTSARQGNATMLGLAENVARELLAANPAPTPDADEVEHLAKVIRDFDTAGGGYGSLSDLARVIIAKGYTRGGTVDAEPLADRISEIIDDPYAGPVEVGYGAGRHMHSEPICAWPSCGQYVLSDAMALMRIAALLSEEGGK